MPQIPAEFGVSKRAGGRVRRYLLQANRRGRVASLAFAPWEEWFALPLKEARRRAGIIPPEIAHGAIGIVVAGRDGGSGKASALRP
jgi:hypothetical protein